MDAYEMRRSAGIAVAPAAAAERITAFLRAVYGWMFVGLAVTGIVAYGVAGSPTILRALVSTPLLMLVLIAAELGMVFYLSARVDRIEPGTAAAMFLGYSALNGVTLSFVVLAYTGRSIGSTFFVSAATFAALATYGTVTRRSLAGMGQFLFMGLVGFVIASVVGMFWHNDALQFVIACIGVIVFTGLAAWDAQRLKEMATALPDGQVGSYAIVGALSLYLDFINLFLILLRFLGDRRD